MKKRLILNCLLSSFSFLFSIESYSQTVHNINALSMSFSPANITIDVGDTVRWTRVTGVHNVNGTNSTYPSNPESFGNALSGSWTTFDHKFLAAGTYNYRCDQHFGSGMTGTITVQELGIQEIDNAENFIKIFPNPSNNSISISFIQDVYLEEYEIHDLNGYPMQKGKFTAEIELDLLNSGYYILILKGDKILRTKILIE